MAKIDNSAGIASLYDEKKSEISDGTFDSRNIQPSKQRLSNPRSPYTLSSALRSPSLDQREVSVASFKSIQELVERHQEQESAAHREAIVLKAKEVVRNFADHPHKSEGMVWGLLPLVFLKDREITRDLVEELVEAIRDKPFEKLAYYEVLTQVVACDLVQEVLEPDDLVKGLKILVGRLNDLHVQQDQKELPQLAAVLSIIEVMVLRGVTWVSKEGIKNPVYQSVDRFSQKPYSLHIRYLASCCKQAFIAIKSDEGKGQMARRKIGKALSAVTRTGILGVRIATGEKLLEMLLSLADAGWGGAGDVHNILADFREAFHRKDSQKHWYRMALLFDEVFSKVRVQEEGWEELLKQIKDKNWKKENWRLLYNLVQNWRDVALNDPQACRRKEALQILNGMFRDKDQWGGKKEMREGVLHALIEVGEQGQEQEAEQAYKILKALRRDYFDKIGKRLKRPTESSFLVREHIPEEEKLESLRDQPKPDLPKTDEADELLQSVQHAQEMMDYPQRVSGQVERLQESFDETQASTFKRVQSLHDLVIQIPQQTAQDSKESYQALGVQISELQQVLTSRPVDGEMMNQLHELTQALQTIYCEAGATQASLKAQIEQLTQEVQTLRHAHPTDSKDSPRIFSVPSLPNDFIKREKKLDELHDLLQQNHFGAINRITIRGLGGSGKTVLAIAYARFYSEAYPLIWWFRAKGNMELQYQELGKEMGLDIGNLNQAEAAAKVREALSRRSGWLLIIDNAEEPNSLQGQFPESPRGGGGHVLVTSRDSRWPDSVPLQSFEESEAIAFLEKKLPNISEDEQRQLAQGLDCFPLALRKAASYIDSQYEDINVKEYLKRYLERKKQLASQDDILSDYDKEKGRQQSTVAAVLQLNFEAVQRQNDKAMKLLQFCAYLDAEGIPTEILRIWCDKKNVPLKECVSILEEYSLLEFDRSTRTFSTHRTVQRFVRQEVAAQPGEESLPIKKSGVLENLWSAVGALGAMLTGEQEAKEEEDPKQKAQRIWIETNVMDVVFKSFNYSYVDSTTLPLAKALASHMEKVFTHAARVGVKCWKDLAMAHAKLGNFLSAQGDFKGAETHYQKALQAYQDHRQADAADLDCACIHNDYGLFLKIRGNLEEALQHCQIALEMRESYHGADSNHEDLAESHNDVGLLLKTQSRFKEAKKHYQRTLDICRECYKDKKNHPHLAIAYGNMGILCFAQDNLEEAKKYFEEALAICKKHYNKDPHPHLALAHDIMGKLFLALCQQEKALSEFETASTMVGEYYRTKASHSKIIFEHQQGLKLELKGHLEKAISHYQQALVLADQNYRENRSHPDFMICYNNLGRAFHLQNQWKQAEKYTRDALAILDQMMASVAPAEFPRSYSPNNTLHLFQRIHLYRQLGEILQAQAEEADQKEDAREAESLHTKAEEAFAQARELDPSL